MDGCTDGRTNVAISAVVATKWVSLRTNASELQQRQQAKASITHS